MDTYKATNTTNGKFYIGSTTNFNKRKKSHLKSKENYPFQNALRKNPEAFEWEVWSDDCEDSVLEQALLDMWFGCEQCYNLNPSAKHPPRDPDALRRGGLTAGPINGRLGDKEGKRKSGLRSKEEQTGFHAPGVASAAGKIGGPRGSKEDKSRAGKLGGNKGWKTTASQRWQNTDPSFPPYVSTAAGLTHWQKARNIDTSLRIQLQ
jgi:hypothetical protein